MTAVEDLSAASRRDSITRVLCVSLSLSPERGSRSFILDPLSVMTYPVILYALEKKKVNLRSFVTTALK